MHLLPGDTRSLDAEVAAEDLGQTPAELVVLSFSDGDLAGLAAAHANHPGLPSLRLANLARLKHPFSIDLYVEKVVARARFVLVRLLGGLDYWRYGADELGAAARRHGVHLAIVPGCERADERLDAASTLPEADLRRLWAWFREGGPDNLAQILRFAGARLGRDLDWEEPKPLPAAALHLAFSRDGVPSDDVGCHSGASEARARNPCPQPRPAFPPESGLFLRHRDLGFRALACGEPGNDRNDQLTDGQALIVFYRSALLAADTAPIEALADVLAARGLGVSAFAVTSLKDAAAAEALARHLAAAPPDVILNATAFSGRLPEGGTVLDQADAPVLQIVQAGIRREAWAASSRRPGLGRSRHERRAARDRRPHPRRPRVVQGRGRTQRRA